MTRRQLPWSPSRLLVIAVVLLTAGAMLAGCARTPAAPPKDDGTMPPAKPGVMLPLSKLASEVQIQSGTHFSSGEAISPDGSKAALLTTDKGQRLWLYDLATKTGRVVDEVSVQRLEAGALLLRTVTWRSDQTLVYIRQGTQPDGAHKDKRGLSFRIAAKEGPQEIAWVPVEPGEYLTNVYAWSGKTDVFAHVSQKLWRVSIAGGAPAVVKKDLPSPVGILVPGFSPTGTHITYQPLKADKTAGLYIMSTGDGKETLVVPRSEAMTFGAEWSPDGKYVAY